MMKDLLYLEAYIYRGCMHKVLFRYYMYKYDRNGLVPGTWYKEYILNPSSVTVDYFSLAPDSMSINAIPRTAYDQDGNLRYAEDFFNKQESWVFTLGEDTELMSTEKQQEHFQKHPGIKTMWITRYGALIIDGTEYNNQYIHDHLMTCAFYWTRSVPIRYWRR